MLVPLDGSALAERILPYVAQISTGFGTEVVLVSVVDTDAIQLPRGFGSREARERQLDEIITSTTSNLETRLAEIVTTQAAHNMHVSTHVATGKPAEEILRAAKEHGCDLIAMSTHGRNVLGQGVLGSVTDKVVHSSDIPTLTILP